MLGKLLIAHISVHLEKRLAFHPSSNLVKLSKCILKVQSQKFKREPGSATFAISFVCSKTLVPHIDATIHRVRRCKYE